MFKQVQEFHNKFGLPVGKTPQFLTNDRTELRWDLLEEELDELNDAYDDGDLVGIADAIGDAIYILLGTAVEHGIPIDEVFDEIHRSNMSKLDEDGKPIYREDGKVLKGPNYIKPDIARILNEYK